MSFSGAGPVPENATEFEKRRNRNKLGDFLMLRLLQKKEASAGPGPSPTKISLKTKTQDLALRSNRALAGTGKIGSFGIGLLSSDVLLKKPKLKSI